jgi:hypothetical protein
MIRMSFVISDNLYGVENPEKEHDVNTCLRRKFLLQRK